MFVSSRLMPASAWINCSSSLFGGLSCLNEHFGPVCRSSAKTRTFHGEHVTSSPILIQLCFLLQWNYSLCHAPNAKQWNGMEIQIQRELTCTSLDEQRERVRPAPLSRQVRSPRSAPPRRPGAPESRLSEPRRSGSARSGSARSQWRVRSDWLSPCWLVGPWFIHFGS